MDGAHVKWPHQGKWRQRRQGGYRTRKEAEAALTELLRQVDIGHAVPIDQLTVAGYLDSWLDHLEHVVGCKPSTVHGYGMTLRHVTSAIGDMRLQKVTAADLDGIYRAMAQRGLSARTTRYLYSILRKAFADAERQGLVATNVVVRSTRLQVGERWVDRGLVFPAPDGDYLKPATLSQQFGRLVTSAGVPRIRLHDLRHTHATLLAEHGQDAKLISERLGHSTVAFTLDRYIKPSTARQIEAANDFTRRLGSQRPT